MKENLYRVTAGTYNNLTIETGLIGWASLEESALITAENREEAIESYKRYVKVNFKNYPSEKNHGFLVVYLVKNSYNVMVKHSQKIVPA